MPIVRELINLVSFAVDKSSQQGAAKSFAGMAKAAALGVSALTIAGGRLAVKYEDAVAHARFFGMEMNDINKLVAEHAGEGFSKLEIAKTVGQLSELAITGNQLDESLRFLKTISIARGFTDSLKDVQENFSKAVQSSDIDALKQLGGVSKFLADKLKLVDFQTAFKNMPETAKVRFVLQVMRDQAKEMGKLAAEQKNTLGYDLDKFMSRGSDALLKFGNTAKPLLREVLGLINDIGDALGRWGDNAVWKGIADIVKIQTEAVKGLRKLVSGGDTGKMFGDFLEGVGIPKRSEKEGDRVAKMFGDFLEGVGIPKRSEKEGDRVAKMFGDFFKNAGKEEGLTPIKGIARESLSQEDASGDMFYNEAMFPTQRQNNYSPQQPAPSGQQALTEQKISVDISGNIKIGNEDISPDLMKKLVEEVEKNISNAFSRIGRAVGNQTAFSPAR